MATRAENIETRLDNIAAELAAMDATEAGGLPNAMTGGGIASVDHVGYRLSLIEEMRGLVAELSRLEGAWEVTSEMAG
jgi:hypothetical protein